MTETPKRLSHEERVKRIRSANWGDYSREDILQGMEGVGFDEVMPLVYEYPNASKRKKITLLYRITSNLVDWQKAVLQVESENVAEHTFKSGYESLTTDTKDYRSLEWFNSSGLAFSTGMASVCAVAAIVHPEIGMAASHRNPFNRQVITKYLENNLDKGSLTDFLPNFSDSGFLSTEDYESTFTLTIGEAFEEFAKLCKQSNQTIPEDGTRVFVSGMETLRNQEEMAVYIVQQVLPQSSPFFSGVSRGRNVSVNVDTGLLGQPGGFIYGGPNHPEYSEVNFGAYHR